MHVYIYIEYGTITLVPIEASSVTPRPATGGPNQPAKAMAHLWGALELHLEVQGSYSQAIVWYIRLAL